MYRLCVQPEPLTSSMRWPEVFITHQPLYLWPQHTRSFLLLSCSSTLSKITDTGYGYILFYNSEWRYSPFSLHESVIPDWGGHGKHVWLYSILLKAWGMGGVLIGLDLCLAEESKLTHIATTWWITLLGPSLDLLWWRDLEQTSVLAIVSHSVSLLSLCLLQTVTTCSTTALPQPTDTLVLVPTCYLLPIEEIVSASASCHLGIFVCKYAQHRIYASSRQREKGTGMDRKTGSKKRNEWIHDGGIIQFGLENIVNQQN